MEAFPTLTVICRRVWPSCPSHDRRLVALVAPSSPSSSLSSPPLLSLLLSASLLTGCSLEPPSTRSTADAHRASRYLRCWTTLSRPRALHPLPTTLPVRCGAPKLTMLPVRHGAPKPIMLPVHCSFALFDPVRTSTAPASVPCPTMDHDLFGYRSVRATIQTPVLPVPFPIYRTAATPSEDENRERTHKRARAVADEDGTEDPVDVVEQPMSPGHLAAKLCYYTYCVVSKLRELIMAPFDVIMWVREEQRMIQEIWAWCIYVHRVKGRIDNPNFMDNMNVLPVRGVITSHAPVAALEPQVHDYPSDVMVSTPLSGVPPIAMVDPRKPNPFLVLDASPVPENQAGPPILQSPSRPTDFEDTPLATSDSTEVQAEQFASNDIPMETEQEPTPLPEFIVNETMLETLHCTLRDSTGSLNVEQLEQLCATSLGCVWRHCSEGNRITLIKEPTPVVQEFAEEVSLDDMDGSTP
ncbi:hypothetical protein WOLCODRAFT_153460 [Wolfiporia cocos MD-104 SS10]|uniref:Uncharacterized protein n=1 Tax=Wolfiporia cocos (strain MD-104) TaxID=742152 RepID=A0A2H3K2X4_WOLCO|nr:hypothetical protein WOLCODRAFT_153460 [Wolfiporia cocos MD-104 SS10]